MTTMIFAENLVTAFTEGDCWVLAKAIFDETGWQMVLIAVSESDPVEEQDQLDWIHMGVRTPEGLFVDIEGVHADPNAYLERWEETYIDHLADPEAYFLDVPQDVTYEQVTSDQVPLHTGEYTQDEFREVVARLIAAAQA